MTEGGEDGETQFAFERTPYARISYLLSQLAPERIDPAELAAEIRKHGLAAMPSPVTEFLCDHLEGKVERRGRPGELPIERKIRAGAARNTYIAVRAVLQNDPEIPNDFVKAVREFERDLPTDLSEGEAALQLLSAFFYGHNGQHKKLRNLVSEHAPINE